MVNGSLGAEADLPYSRQGRYPRREVLVSEVDKVLSPHRAVALGTDNFQVADIIRASVGHCDDMSSMEITCGDTDCTAIEPAEPVICLH